jgi:hypothetical protein
MGAFTRSARTEGLSKATPRVTLPPSRPLPHPPSLPPTLRKQRRPLGGANQRVPARRGQPPGPQPSARPGGTPDPAGGAPRGVAHVGGRTGGSDRLRHGGCGQRGGDGHRRVRGALAHGGSDQGRGGDRLGVDGFRRLFVVFRRVGVSCLASTSSLPPSLPPAYPP